MRIVAAATVILLPLSASAAAPQPAVPLRPQVVTSPSALQCAQLGARHATGSEAPLANRLADLPPGSLHLAVQREVDGCVEPVIVRQNVGGTQVPPQQRREGMLRR